MARRMSTVCLSIVIDGHYRIESKAMEDVITEILEALRHTDSLSPAELDRIVRKHSKRAHDGRRIFAKKNILPYYLNVKKNDLATWASWDVDNSLDRRFIETLRMKPRRTASGVATITVITKPWPCSSSCIYCPNDIRMPKSYLHDEPACQRAERNWFDPYLQVSARLRTLHQMGHATDKIELIVLGGTWSDYPLPYQVWFIEQLFEALNDDDETRSAKANHRQAVYRAAGIESDPDLLLSAVSDLQKRIEAHEISFNEAYAYHYDSGSPWNAVAAWQKATLDELDQRHEANEKAIHHVVGLVIETRPDLINCTSLTFLRKLGCTKIQMGIQSVDEELLALNGRATSLPAIRRAFELCRLFGFKTHAHFMVNLYGATPESDKRDYQRFMRDPSFAPDEVKLYPCALVAGTKLVELYEQGLWRPYTEQELIDVLVNDLLQTPPYCRISRMIRDISAKDILVGNKKTNLRQIVEQAVDNRVDDICEIRFREIASDSVSLDDLRLDIIAYETTTTDERFLQWVTESGKIAGFLRLSLPHSDALRGLSKDFPVHEGEAMIREVHVYGTASALHAQDGSTQHRGLGQALVERACAIAHEQNYHAINVISAIGTRDYYRSLGFTDNGLYQHKVL